MIDKIVFSFVLIGVLILSPTISFSQENISPSVIAGGGGNMFNTEYQISGTVGQPLIGISNNVNFLLGSGFWSVSGSVTSLNGDENILPTEYNLYQNYPNPFNPSTIIKYSVPERSNVIIQVFNIVGEEIEILVNQEKDSGFYEVQFSGVGLASGIYIYRITAGNFFQSKKMLLIK